MNEEFGNLRKWWLVCLAATIVLSLLAVFAFCRRLPWPDVLSGWVVAGVNGLSLFLVSRKAVGLDRERFVRWGIVGNALRIVALIGILALYRFLVEGQFAAFALTVVAGVLVFMGAEVARLNQALTRESGQRTR